MIYYQVNAFTYNSKNGNPAGVVICDGDDFPSEERMQGLAAAYGHSETAFVLAGSADGELSLRYFTPECEVDLCGHATIASFKALMDARLVERGRDYVCHTKAGDVTVKPEQHFISMETAHGRVISTVKDKNSLQVIYSSLDTPYDPVRIMPACNRFINLNPMVVDNGLPFLIVPINGVDKLNALTPNKELIMEISRALQCAGIYAFAFEPKEIGLMAHCRGFYPLIGIDEESATGTGVAALSFYLNGFGTLPAEREATYLQGEAMDRTSELITFIKGSGDNMRILVGGDAEIIEKRSIRM